MSGEYPIILEKEGIIHMKIYKETSLANFEGWSGAEDTLNRIIAEGKCDMLEAILEDMYPEGIDETNLNDLLRFESDTVFEWLGIRTESEIRQELEDAREELEELKQNYADECEDEDMTDEEKSELWQSDYADDASELEEELENI